MYFVFLNNKYLIVGDIFKRNISFGQTFSSIYELRIPLVESFLFNMLDKIVCIDRQIVALFCLLQ